MDKPILKKRKDDITLLKKPILNKRKEYQPIKLCNNIIDDGYFTGVEKRCGRPVQLPNRFLCSICLRHAESVEQLLGYEV